MTIKICKHELEEAILDYLNKKMGSELDDSAYMEITIIQNEVIKRKKIEKEITLVPHGYRDSLEESIEIFIEPETD